MHIRRSRYLRHRFPPEIISHAVWLYHRYCLSFRDVEDLLAERGIIVSYETIRQWCGKFGPDYARRLKRRQGRLGDTWLLDEVFVAINGQRQYLWRAVDQDGDLIDLLVQPRRDGRAARRFFRQLLKSQRQEPCRLVTDKLGSYRVAQRDARRGHGPPGSSGTVGPASLRSVVDVTSAVVAEDITLTEAVPTGRSYQSYL